MQLDAGERESSMRSDCLLPRHNAPKARSPGLLGWYEVVKEIVNLEPSHVQTEVEHLDQRQVHFFTGRVVTMASRDKIWSHMTRPLTTVKVASTIQYARMAHHLNRGTMVGWLNKLGFLTHLSCWPSGQRVETDTSGYYPLDREAGPG